MPKELRGYCYLTLTAMIWGCAFVAQSVGMDYIGPFTFQALRCLLGAITLLPVILLHRRKTGAAVKSADRKTLLTGGICCGIALFAATNLQQLGLMTTTVSKSGFISALYILIVPILGVFFHKKIRPIIWLCVFAACCGLYLLSMHEGISRFSIGDGFTLMCAFCFAVHILVVDYFSPKCDGVILSCIQFLVASLLSGVCMLITEKPDFSNIAACWLPLSYTGILSSGVAYTLQILAQKDTRPAIATLLMSLESVFAAVFGWLLLNEALSTRELLGCALMFGATLVALLPEKHKRF